MASSAPNKRVSFRLGVNAKISLLIVLVSSLTLLGFTLYDSRRADQDMRAQLTALGERIANRLSLSISSPAWDMNWQSLRMVVQSEMRNRNVACIRYQDASDQKTRITFGRGADWSLQESPDCPEKADIWTSRDIQVRGAVLGVVSVGIDDRFERQAISARVRDSFLRLLLLELLLVAALYLSLRFVFIAPVTSLSRLAERMTRTRNYDLEAPGAGNDEIGLLVRNFNALIGEVRSREERLQSHSRLLEEQVAARTAELSLKARELEAANIRLKRLDAMKTAILSTVSHELRTPLTSVLGYSSLAGKIFNKHFAQSAGSDPEKNRRAAQINQNLNIIAEEGRRLTRLINDFLDLSRIEAGKAVWNDQIVDVTELIRKATRAIAGQLPPGSPVALSASLPDVPVIGTVDPDRYSQVLLNLMNNALKFTAKGEVTVAARLSPERVLRVCVSDTGAGIAREELPGLFEKFHQVPREDHERKPGAGLGLAICRQIAERYDGMIWVESEPGRGSRFYFELPLDPEDRDVAEEAGDSEL